METEILTMQEEQKETAQKEKEAAKMAADFKLAFYTRFAVKPSVHYDFSKTFAPNVPLPKLEEITNHFLEIEHPGKFQNGIRTKKRKGELIIYRHLFFHLSIEMGYTQMSTGDFLGYSHCMVSFASQKIKLKLEKENKYVTELYNKILDKVKEEITLSYTIPPSN